MDRGDRSTRDKVRTRAAIIESAIALMTAQGRGVSLANIAQHAGVSKGALTYHFPSRHELEEALLSDAVERFQAEVFAHVDLSENRSGTLLRGYIRALTSDSVLMRELFSPASLLVALGLDQPFEELMHRDAESWREAFSHDGIDAATSLALRLAAEGFAAAVETPYLKEEERASVRGRLLQLADPAAV